MIAMKLDAAIRAVCPINGVSIGRTNDKSTWRIDYADEATAEQRQAARAVVDAFDPNQPRDYRELRLEAYRERGATETACIEAIIEYMAGKPEKMTTLAAIRDSVKRDFPKP